MDDLTPAKFLLGIALFALVLLGMVASADSYNRHWQHKSRIEQIDRAGEHAMKLLKTYLGD